ncbi:endochitinase [Salix suchowensis]|nr:endochitinase [Salix suchowensis]
MATGSSRRTSSGSVIRSISPSGRFHQHLSRSPSASPTRVNMYGNSTPSSASSVRLNAVSPNRSISTVNPSRSRHQQVVRKQSTPKRTCMCSPTTHPGSFRCSLHKGLGFGSSTSSSNFSSNNNRLNARRSAMTNSLVRIGGVEGDLVRRALAALIRPSSHQQRRRAAFQPRPSRLSQMSKLSAKGMLDISGFYLLTHPARTGLRLQRSRVEIGTECFFIGIR